MPKSRNRYKVDDLQSSTSPKLPARNFVPQPKQNISLPPSTSIPPPTGDLVCTNADDVKNLAAKSSMVSNLKFRNKIFPTKKFLNTENEYEAVKEVQTLNGPHVLCTDAELPQEYLPPPPFAPGYWPRVSSNMQRYCCGNAEAELNGQSLVRLHSAMDQISHANICWQWQKFIL